ncbi:MAG TPA: aspartyl/asparaginyl beta-hydroxylase domain-containing protein [Verrucomicrobiae bacterium]|nr:aspartyl/asparaginyl beta-hydroxylase domain-containing protein [Verrucomicrobiae bacterium]
MTTPAIPASLKLDLQFDVARLQADLQGIIAGEYVPHFNLRYYEGNWSVVPLRSIGGQPGHIYPDPTRTMSFADTPLVERCPYFREIMQAFPCKLQAVRLLRLNAGSVIKEHSDYKLSYADAELRLHIPVVTNPDVEFFLNNQRVVMGEGECWYNDFTLPHRIANRGATDRIHLVIDCELNDWLRGVFERSLAVAPALVKN